MSPGALLLALLIGGCGVHQATGTASQRDIAEFRDEFQALSASLQRSQRQIELSVAGIDRRTREETGRYESLLRSLNTRLDSLDSRVNALASRLDSMESRGDGGRRPATAQTPVSPAGPPAASPPGPGRSAVAPTPAPTPAPAPAVPPSSASPAPRAATATGLQSQDVYQMAYLDFKKGSYALAIEGFREFLRRFPREEHADDAQYWIGESHLALARSYERDMPDKAKQERESAVREFRKVIANYPRGVKVPTALYREALTLIELDQKPLARTRLQYLVDNFPRAEEAPLAKEQLAALKP
jgi:tol-pal system protein YbgF